MADIQYLNYGDLQVEELALLNTLTDRVPRYLEEKPWSTKRKNKFMSAYSDIIKNGIVGVSNNGRWELEVNGNLDINPKDLDIYLDVAYFIKEEMSKLPTKASIEANRPVFDNNVFKENFGTYVNSNVSGGNKLKIGYGEDDLWNRLDERDENGIRNTTKREKKLAELLEGYYKKQSEEFNKYKFDGSPYESLEEFHRRISDVITKLNSENTENARLAMYALGLNYADWFNNGSGDPSGTIIDGKNLTYSELALYKTLQQLLKIKEELQKIKEETPQQQLSLESDSNLPVTPAYNERKLLFGKDSAAQNWETEDYARIVAALGDIISLGGLHANLIGSGTSLVADTTADIADETLSKFDVIKNLGSNLMWAAAGFIPGAKLGKVGKNIARWAPKLAVALLNYNLLNDKSNKETFDKLTSGRLVEEGLSSKDLQNIMYWVRAFTGTVNAGKATARDIKYSKARGTQGQKFKTKSGEEISLTNEEVDKINAIGARKGQKAAEAKFKEIAKEKTGVEHELKEGEIKFSENGRTGIFKDTRSKLQDSRLQGESVVFRTPEQQYYYNKLLLDRAKGGWGGWRPFWRRGTSSYFDHFDSGVSFNTNRLKSINKKWDPYYKELHELSSNLPSSNPMTNPILRRQRSIQNALFVPGRKLRRQSKVIKVDNHGVKGIIGDASIEYEGMKFKYDADSNTYSEWKGGKWSKIKGIKSLDEFNKHIAEKIKLHHNISSTDDVLTKLTQELIDKILDLRRKGFLLKLGGMIDKQKILKYKNFINK